MQKQKRSYLNYTIAIIFSLLIVSEVLELMDGRPAIYRRHNVNIFKEPVDVSSHIVTDMNGKRHNLSDLKGEISILAFWAPWCGYCRHEFPQINAISEKLRAQGVNVIPIVKDTEDPEQIINFYRKLQLGNIPPFISGEGELYGKLGVRAFPSFILLNKNGVAFGNARPEWGSEDIGELFLKIKELGV